MPTVLSTPSQKWSATTAASFEGPAVVTAEPVPLPRLRLLAPARGRARSVVEVVVLVGVAAVLRFYQLGTENFWIDEISSLQVAAQPIANIIRNYSPSADLAFRDQAPLSFFVAHFFISPVAAEWWARLPSALCGTLGVFALVLVGREVLAGPVPVLAAVLLALSPLDVWYSQEVRWYAQWTLLMTLSYLAFLRVWKRGGRRAWLGYVVVTLLGVYTFVFSFFVIAGQAISAWMLQRLEPARRGFLLRLLAAQGVITVAAAPVIWLVGNQLNFSAGTPRPTYPAALPYTLFAYAVGFSAGPPLVYLHTVTTVQRILIDYPAVIAVFALFLSLLVLALRGLRGNRPAAAVLLPWLLTPILLVFALALCTHVTYQVRYTLAALPAFCLLVALGVCTINSREACAIVAAAILGSSCGSLANHYWSPVYGKEDVRGALNYARSAGARAQPILAIGQIDGAVKYYGADLRVVPITSCDIDADGHDALKAATLQDARGVWLIVGRDWDGHAHRCRRRLARSYGVAARRHFAGVDLWLLRRLGSAVPLQRRPA
jgi:mannosyltransferase